MPCLSARRTLRATLPFFFAMLVKPVLVLTSISFWAAFFFATSRKVYRKAARTGEQLHIDDSRQLTSVIVPSCHRVRPKRSKAQAVHTRRPWATRTTKETHAQPCAQGATGHSSFIWQLTFAGLLYSDARSLRTFVLTSCGEHPSAFMAATCPCMSWRPHGMVPRVQKSTRKRRTCNADAVISHRFWRSPALSSGR